MALKDYELLELVRLSGEMGDNYIEAENDSCDPAVRLGIQADDLGEA